MPESFDSYSKNYNELLNNSIRQTGYDVENLVAAKLHKLRSLFPSLSENSTIMSFFPIILSESQGKNV